MTLDQTRRRSSRPVIPSVSRVSVSRRRRIEEEGNAKMGDCNWPNFQPKNRKDEDGTRLIRWRCRIVADHRDKESVRKYFCSMSPHDYELYQGRIQF